MSKTTQALIIKFFITLLAVALTFGLINFNSLGNLFVIALLATGLNYLLGDLVVLPKYGNTFASLGDGLLGVVTAYIYGTISLTLFFLLITIGEYFFHKYLLDTKKVAPNE
jgi:hypothetical protein